MFVMQYLQKSEQIQKIHDKLNTNIFFFIYKDRIGEPPWSLRLKAKSGIVLPSLFKMLIISFIVVFHIDVNGFVLFFKSHDKFFFISIIKFFDTP